MDAGLVAVIFPNAAALEFLRKLCAAAGIAEPLVDLSPPESIRFVRDHLSEIDVVFVMHRPDGAALSVVRDLRRRVADTPLIVIAESADADLAGPAMEAGASGLIVQNGSVARSAEILSAILEHACPC